MVRSPLTLSTRPRELDSECTGISDFQDKSRVPCHLPDRPRERPQASFTEGKRGPRFLLRSTTGRNQLRLIGRSDGDLSAPTPKPPYATFPQENLLLRRPRVPFLVSVGVPPRGSKVRSSRSPREVVTSQIIRGSTKRTCRSSPLEGERIRSWKGF